jgi:spermidine synthase
MSIVWEQVRGGTRYQVRRAGGSLRLYTNGVLHSQYNPARPLTGSVWDLLTVPAFLLAPGAVRRVLVLGIGGGAVIQQLRHFVQPHTVLGVELSAVHLTIARRFFGVRGEGVRLVRADAVQWLRAYRGAPFDLVVDDLFGDVHGQPVRAVAADRRWSALLLRHLTPHGIVVVNFPTRQELEASALLCEPRIRACFASAFRLSTAQNDNAVGAFCRMPTSSRQLRERLRKTPGLDPRRSRLRYRIRSLPG